MRPGVCSTVISTLLMSLISRTRTSIELPSARLNNHKQVVSYTLVLWLGSAWLLCGFMYVFMVVCGGALKNGSTIRWISFFDRPKKRVRRMVQVWRWLWQVQCPKHTLRVSIIVDWFVQYALSRIGQWLMRVVQGAGAMNTAYWIPVFCVVTLGPSGMIYRWSSSAAFLCIR